MRSQKSRTAVTLALLALGAAATAEAQSNRMPERPYTTWRTYGGGGHSSQYSALEQIDKSNVAQLAVLDPLHQAAQQAFDGPLIHGLIGGPGIAAPAGAAGLPTCF
jgi:hypothetical protein